MALSILQKVLIPHFGPYAWWRFTVCFVNPICFPCRLRNSTHLNSSPKAISSFSPGVHSSPFDGAKQFSLGKGWLISPSLVSPGASYALPQLLYMPFILLIQLHLLVKPSPGWTPLYPLKPTSSHIICSFLNYGITSHAWTSTLSHTQGTHSVEVGRLLHINQGYHLSLLKPLGIGVLTQYSFTSLCHLLYDFAQLTCFANPFLHTHTPSNSLYTPSHLGLGYCLYQLIIYDP